VFELGPAIVDFATYHRSRANRVLHYVGLPAIAGAVLGALSYLTIPGTPVDAAVILLGATLVLDLVLNARIAVGVFVLGGALYALARMLPLPVLAGIYVVGWACQLVGHRAFEKNSPAFTKNLVHLFVGPRFIVNRIVRALPEAPSPHAK
jgi:uncharacterized membrane protein YGL010W